MILKTLKRTFSETLMDYYPETEIDSFFSLLTEDILKMKRVDVALNMYAVVSGKKQEKYTNAIKRLKANEPIQYILGKTKFYGLTFKVNPNVLIPRPETEELVDWIITCHSEQNEESKQLNVLDIGTGSGCIAISLAKNLQNAKVYALDISREALKVAAFNAKANNIAIECIEADILNPVLNDLKYDVIVSNPPYVRDLEKQQMHHNVLDYEPDLALFVRDENPLIFYEAIAKFAKNNLKEKGALYFEINEYLGEEMITLLNKNSFVNIELRNDIQGKDRMIKAYL